MGKKVMIFFLPFSDKCIDDAVILDDIYELWEIFHSMYVSGVACNFHSYSWKCTAGPCRTCSMPG
jgi:hypothetical protein